MRSLISSIFARTMHAQIYHCGASVRLDGQRKDMEVSIKSEHFEKSAHFMGRSKACFSNNNKVSTLPYIFCKHFCPDSVSYAY